MGSSHCEGVISSRIGAVLRRLNDRYPEGLYLGIGVPLLQGVEPLTPHGLIRRPVERVMGWTGESWETPAFFSEVWQLCWLLLSILLLSIGSPPLLAWLLVIRLYDLLVFAFHWALGSPRPELKSIRRSLIAFSLNVVEVVVIFAVFFVSYGCARSAEVAIYESVRTVVTIGPFGPEFSADKALPCCRAILVAQIVVSYTLTVFIIASLVGRIREKTGGGTAENVPTR